MEWQTVLATEEQPYIVGETESRVYYTGKPAQQNKTGHRGRERELPSFCLKTGGSSVRWVS